MGFSFVFMTTVSFLLGEGFKRERGTSYHVFYGLPLEDVAGPTFLPYSSLEAGIGLEEGWEGERFLLYCFSLAMFISPAQL